MKIPDKVLKKIGRNSDLAIELRMAHEDDLISDGVMVDFMTMADVKAFKQASLPPAEITAKTLATSKSAIEELGKIGFRELPKDHYIQPEQVEARAQRVPLMIPMEVIARANLIATAGKMIEALALDSVKGASLNEGRVVGSAKERRTGRGL